MARCRHPSTLTLAWSQAGPPTQPLPCRVGTGPGGAEGSSPGSGAWQPRSPLCCWAEARPGSRRTVGRRERSVRTGTAAQSRHGGRGRPAELTQVISPLHRGRKRWPPLESFTKADTTTPVPVLPLTRDAASTQAGSGEEGPAGSPSASPCPAVTVLSPASPVTWVPAHVTGHRYVSNKPAVHIVKPSKNRKGIFFN